MHRSYRTAAAACVCWLLCAVPASAGVEVYAAMGIDKGKVFSGTQVTARVLPGDEKQVVCLVAYFSGKNENSSIRLRLAVLQKESESLRVVWEQDFSAKYGSGVGVGDLQLFDLDRDGRSEIIVTFDQFSDPLIRQRFGEVIVWEEEGGFTTGWSGTFEYDATKSVRDVPLERRDRYVREIDLASTLRTRGVTLFINKTMIAVAGERLAEPKVVKETFPLRKRLDF